ncbi:hypothetical protein H0H81_010076 [Sphagnurus paluster]|uniref:Uncharacterized protein n=1 Tax=Sphagnurus paluster TaxID=117069 RepID=A0A9P7K456_9AGAR|nr:hypothetical protein H0H81_010076 [Sphagnurus paluster]
MPLANELCIAFPDDLSKVLPAHRSRFTVHHLFCGLEPEADLDNELEDNAEADDEPDNLPANNEETLLPITIDELIRDSDDGDLVYRARLEWGERVVLKVRSCSESLEALSEEADVYEKDVAEVQGTAVPKYYGVCQWQCADPLEVDHFLQLDEKDRRKIMEKMAEFHLGSNQHIVDFATYNVLVQDGEFRFISFYSQLNPHTCPFDGRWHFGERRDPRHWSCCSLAGIGDKLGGITGRSYPSQEIIDALLSEDTGPQDGVFRLETYKWLKSVNYFADEEGIDAQNPGEEGFNEIMRFAIKPTRLGCRPSKHRHSHLHTSPPCIESLSQPQPPTAMSRAPELDIKIPDDLSKVVPANRARFIPLHHLFCGVGADSSGDASEVDEADPPPETAGKEPLVLPVTIDELFRDTGDGDFMYRVRLSNSGERIMLKMASFPTSRKALHEEADVYEEDVKAVQGTAVPKFYGLYEWKCVHGVDMACMVLGDCGDPLGVDDFMQLGE